MGYRTAFKEVMREYERDREISQARLEEKRRAVYIQVPRIAEIERQLKLIGLKFAREILSHNSENINPDPKRELSELIAEKKHLLAENSFGTDYLNLEYKCNICQDTGFVDNKRCVCLKQRLADKYYNLSDLKKTLKNEHFGTFNLKCYADKTGAEGISPRDKMKVIL
ncbi:MAG: hypothetical protein LBQ68_07290, partial [Clostridiales bacterium]|nr:hypothetical protein [Clostridiales bacterium]